MMAAWPMQVEIRPPNPFSNIKNDCILWITYCMQGSELNAFCVLYPLIPATTLYTVVGSWIIPILGMKRLRLREVKQFDQGHTPPQWSIQDQDSGLTIGLLN